MFGIPRQTEHPTLCLTQPFRRSNAHPSLDTLRSTQGCGAQKRSAPVQSVPTKNAPCKKEKKNRVNRHIHMCRPTSSSFQSTSNAQRFRRQENSHQALVRFFFFCKVCHTRAGVNIFTHMLAPHPWLRQLPSQNPQIAVTSDQTKSDPSAHAPVRPLAAGKRSKCARIGGDRRT